MHQIWRLQHFLAVAEKGSFHAASRAINISQPALTKSIRALETHMGTGLFERLPRGIRLTDAGSALYERARKIEVAWNASLAEIDAFSRGATGRLRIGAGPVYSTVYFPELLFRIGRQFPRLRIEVSTGVGSVLLPALKSGDISLYAGGLPKKPILLGHEFTTLELSQHENVLVAGADHILFSRPAIHVEDLLKYPWLRLVYDHEALERIEFFFARYGLPPPQFQVETQSMLMALRLISEKGFITSFPAPLIESLPSCRLRRLPFDDFAWKISTGLTFRKSALELAPLRSIVGILKELTAS